jgi:hypothetical protein
MAFQQAMTALLITFSVEEANEKFRDAKNAQQKYKAELSFLDNPDDPYDPDRPIDPSVEKLQQIISEIAAELEEIRPFTSHYRYTH